MLFLLDVDSKYSRYLAAAAMDDTSILISRSIVQQVRVGSRFRVASIYGTLFLESRAFTLTLNSNIILFILVCVHYISMSCWNNLHHLARGLAICVDSIGVSALNG